MSGSSLVPNVTLSQKETRKRTNNSEDNTVTTGRSFGHPRQHTETTNLLSNHPINLAISSAVSLQSTSVLLELLRVSVLFSRFGAARIQIKLRLTVHAKFAISCSLFRRFVHSFSHG